MIQKCLRFAYLAHIHSPQPDFILKSAINFQGDAELGRYEGNKKSKSVAKKYLKIV